MTIVLPPHTKLGPAKLNGWNKKKGKRSNHRKPDVLYGKYETIRKTPRFKQWRRNQFLRQGGTCYYCHEPLWNIRSNVEHVQPRSKGGNNNWANLVLACSKCNKEKGSDIIPRKKLKELHAINKKKRGTYLENRRLYPGEEEVMAEILRHI